MGKYDEPNDYFVNLIKEVRVQKNTLTLDKKKEMFIDYVIEACRRFKISVPVVKFEKLEHFSHGEDGHYEVELCRICVDEGKLNFLKEDKIRELAYHEVSHAFTGEHDDHFWKIMRSGMNGGDGFS